MAEAILALSKKELAKRIRDELDAEAREALRSLVHPETGETLQVKACRYQIHPGTQLAASPIIPNHNIAIEKPCSRLTPEPDPEGVGSNIWYTIEAKDQVIPDFEL